jgi:hypothetical protein
MYDDTFKEWIIADRADNKKVAYPANLYLLRDGKVVFYEDDFDGVELFQYNFQDGVLINYYETFDNQKGVYVTLTISPAMQDYRFFNNSTDWRRKSRTRYIKPWQESFIPPIEETPYKAQEDTTPRVIKVNWINKSNEVVNSSHYEENLGLEIDLNNPNGGKVKISITKKDNTNFDNNTKEIVLEEYVTGNKVAITDFKVKKEWEDFKNVEIDELVATATYFNSTKESTSLEIIAPPKVIVDFRPSKKYDGEYGFDYMRDKNKKDNLTYKDLLQVVKTGKLVKDTGVKYKDLKDNQYKVLTFPWYKDSAGKEIEYIQSWLTLYPQQTVTLSLQLETINNPKKLDVCLEYDTELFKLNTDTIPAQSKKKKKLDDFLTVECLKEFSTDQTIKVMYGNQQLGQLNILANAKSKRKKAQVVFIKVKTELYNGTKLDGNTVNKTGKTEKEMLTRYLKQAYTKLELDEITFNLTVNDPLTKKPKYPDFNKNYTLLDLKGKKILNKYHNTGGDSLAKYMEKTLNKELPQYKDHFKVFFFGDSGGRKDKKVKIKGLAGYAKDLNSKSAIMFAGKRKVTLTHELLHCMGLRHSFDPRAKFTYVLKKTHNIMDYSSVRKHTWFWQWKQLWTNKDLKNE